MATMMATGMLTMALSVNIRNFVYFLLTLPLQNTAIRPGTKNGTSGSNVRNCTPARDIIVLLGISNASRYDRHLIPKQRVTVKIGVRVQRISGVNDMSQDFVLEVLMAESWLDKRLAFYQYNPCARNISLGRDTYETIWSPNICFVNTKTATVHESPFRNQYVMVFSSGYVWTEYRTTLVAPCQTQLADFPMDKTVCKIAFESIAYSTREIRLRWIPRVDGPIHLKPHHKVLKDYYISDVSASRGISEHPAGKWDEMVMKFTFVRRYGWYMLNVYVPTYFIVFVSWVSFFLGPRAIPARTMIGVNALVAMTLQFGRVLQDLPRVNYVKAIDIWMFTGMSFVFASLIELAIIGRKSRLDDIRFAAAVNASNSGLSRASVARAMGSVQYSQAEVSSHQNTHNPVTPKTTSLSLRSRKKAKNRLLRSDLNSLSLKSMSTRLEENNSTSRLRRDTLDTLNGFDLLPFEEKYPRVIYRSSHKKLSRRWQTSFAWSCMGGKKPKCKCTTISVEIIDKFSAIMFPTMFFIFNVVYWSYYLTVNN